MAKLNAVDSLKESIRLLEIRHTQERKILKEQFRITAESFTPVNLIKRSMNEFTGSLDLKTSLLETVISLGSGYLTRRFIVSPKSNVLMKMVGVVLQFGVTNLVSKNSEGVRHFLSNLIERFTASNEEEEEEDEDEVTFDRVI